MKRAERDGKLEFGLRAYADSIEAGGTLTGFRQRLGSWPVYAAAAGSALALSTSALASTIIDSGPLPLGTQSVSILGNKFSVAFRTVSTAQRFSAAAFLSGHGIATTAPGEVKAFLNGTSAFGATKFSGSGLKVLRFDSFVSTLHGPQHHSGGQWPTDPGIAYAAMKLNNGDPGWLEIQVFTNFSNGLPAGTEIMAYAYEESGGSPSTVPEPSSLALALLASGSVGVLAFRRRRKGAAAQATDSVK